MEKEKIYICPTCGKEFKLLNDASKHFMKCWKELNPHHKSKPAPRSQDKNTREINKELLDFFSSFGKE